MISFSFTVKGTEFNPYPSTQTFSFEQVVAIEAETAGEALRQLNESVLEWDMLDSSEPFAIEARVSSVDPSVPDKETHDA